MDGVGDITRGVAGTAFGEDMLGVLRGVLRAKYGSDGARMTPDNGRVQVPALSQANVLRGIKRLASEAMMGGLVARQGASSGYYG
jgi:hypothetical protein